MASIRHILIVEDDDDTRNFLVEFCKDASNELLRHGLKVELKIYEASSYEQAMNILQTSPIDLVSLDLTLKYEIEKRYQSDAERRKGKDPGGMRILGEMQKMQKSPIAMVMSGETLLSFATEALQKYGVFAYFQKSKDEINFKPAVVSVLWYLEAVTLISKIDIEAEYDVIDLADEYWEYAQSVASKIGRVNFPSDLNVKIIDIKSKLDPAAKVPGHTWTESVLRSNVLGKNQWALIKYQIINYDAFASSQASQIAPLLTYITKIVKEKCQELGLSRAYVGVWRHEHLASPSILAVFNQNGTIVGKIAKTTLEEVQDKSSFFQYAFDNATVKPQITNVVWDSDNDAEEFSDWPQIVDTLSNSAK